MHIKGGGDMGRALVIVSTAVAIIMAVAFSQPCSAADMTPYQIMKKSDDLLDQAKDSKSDMTMILINKKGDKRIRKLLSYGRNYNKGVKKALLIFKLPADVKGTSFLNWTYPKKEDKQWLYLPALARVRQISSASKGESFMGTEFSYYDMSRHHLDDYTYALLKEEAYDGHMCYVIEGIPKEIKYYSKVISWIRKDNFIPIKMDFYDKKGKYLKQNIVKKIETIKGINTPMYMEMHNVQSNRTTVIKQMNVRYDTGIPDRLFTERYMKRGR